MNTNLITATQNYSSFATTLNHKLKICERFTKQLSSECLKKTAQITVTVGPYLARMATPLAIALAIPGTFFALDNALISSHISHHLNEKEWFRCILGRPNEKGLYEDYILPSNSWYPGFKKHIVNVLRDTSKPDTVCTDDPKACQTCSIPKAVYGTNVILSTALLVYFSGRIMNRLVGVANEYLYRQNNHEVTALPNNLIKLGESVEPSLSVLNAEQNYQTILNLSQESKISSVITGVVLDQLSMTSAILPKRIPAPFIESEDERIKAIVSLALSIVPLGSALQEYRTYIYPNYLWVLATSSIAAGLAYYGVTTLHGHMHSQQLSNQLVPIINEVGKHIQIKTTKAIANGDQQEVHALRAELKTMLRSKIVLMNNIYYHAGFYKKSILDMVKPLENSLKESLQRLET